MAGVAHVPQKDRRDRQQDDNEPQRNHQRFVAHRPFERRENLSARAQTGKLPIDGPGAVLRGQCMGDSGARFEFGDN